MGFTILFLLLRFPALSLGFIILLPLLRSPARYPGSTILLLRSSAISLASSFFFCVPSYIPGVHHYSSSAFPAISLGFTILLLVLLRFQLYLWGSSFFFFFGVPSYNLWDSLFFFCIRSYISGVHHFSSSFAFPAIYLGFTILFLLLRSQALSLGFTTLLPLLRSPAKYLGSPVLLLYTYIYGIHHSFSSSAFRSCLWGSPFFFFCVPSYIYGIHHSSSSAFPAVSVGFTIFGEFCVLPVFESNHRGTTRWSYSVFVGGAYWVCFCCWHSPV